MAILVRNPETGMLTVPEAAYKKWGANQAFSKEFAQLLDYCQHTLGYAEPLKQAGAVPAGPSPPKVNSETESVSDGSPMAKKPRVMKVPAPLSLPVLDNADISGPWILERRLANIRGDVAPLSFHIHLYCCCQYLRTWPMWCVLPCV